ncbi:oligosaccharide flippase family protein [Moheibacter sediminis]|uniref:Membrane protein involved in the export of O-antigen and teichoic acid n=1 Tax=Moheibacter sediminis TaxID=1434700 RepID=A0A1W1YGN2_9FLAO|nr:oligosaccharide flippase family protein [Moheibacter sediminis]SMC35309.1 Membrane protein involved in the export of O-antigen and teichoic acid [Moheibacter sediminis]
MKINTKQFRTKNFKGVVSLFAGNTLSKFILTVFGFVLANYYNPENYAVYSVFLSYVMIMPVLASFRLDNIMILQKGSKEIRNLFNGIIWISLMVTILLTGILFLIKKSNLLQIEMSYFVLFLCGLATVLTAWNNAQNSLFSKFKLFKQMSTAFVLASIFSVLFQGIFYFAGYVENGLIYGWLVGLLVSFIYNARVAKDRLGALNIPLLKKSVKEHFEVVKFTYPSDSINIIANNILLILAFSYFEKVEVGIFALAFKMLTTPLSLLSGSVSRVYFQKSVTLYNHDIKQLASLTYRVILSNAGIIFLFLVFMNTAGIYLLDLFLKDAWQGLGEFILILSFWILARSALNPIITILLVMKKNHYSLIFNIYLLLVNFAAIGIGVMKNDFSFGIMVFSALSGIGYLILTGSILWNLKQLKLNNAA